MNSSTPGTVLKDKKHNKRTVLCHYISGYSSGKKLLDWVTDAVDKLLSLWLA